MNIRQIIWILLTVIILPSCGSDNAPLPDSYDRSAMLTQLADRMIIPGYDSTRTALSDMRADWERAEQDGTISDSEAETLRSQFQNVLRRWQGVVSFNFGPAEGDLGTLTQELATFPCDTVLVERRISEGDTTTSNFRRDGRGFSALDYLLFARTTSQIAATLSGDDGSRRRSYLRAVLRRADNDLTAVANEWKSSYRTLFVNRNGTDAGSSVSLLLNELNKSFELLKNYKLGLPLGLRAGQQTAEPTKIEAFYSGLSFELLRLHFQSIREIWSGHLSDDAQITTFRDYLRSVVNGPRLVDETEVQIARIDAAFLTISQSRMDELIRSNPQALILLHTELQKLTRFIKSEMSSLLGISITYSSGDGD